MPFSGKIAEAYVDIKTNTKGYEQSLSSIRGSLGKIAGLTSAAFAIKGLARFSFNAMKLAGDLTEIESMFEVVFQGVTKEANMMAESLSKDFDLAKSTSMELLNTTGDLLTGFGFSRKEALGLSNEVARLAGDLASLKNIEGGAGEASSRLTSAMIGNTKAARSLGIAYNQMDASFKKQITDLMESRNLTKEQARALVVLEIATKQSKNSIGDYARTLESFANRQRKLTQTWKSFREVIGASLNDFTMASNGLNDLSGDIDSLGAKIDAFQKTGGFATWGASVKETFKGVGAFIVLIFDVISTSISVVVNEWISLFRLFGSALENLFKGNFKGMKEDFKNFGREYADGIKSLVDPFKDYYDKIGNIQAKSNVDIANNNKSILENLKKGWAENSDDFVESQTENQEAIKKTSKAFSGLSEDLRSQMQQGVLGNTKIDGIGDIGKNVDLTKTTSATPSIGGTRSSELLQQLVDTTVQIRDFMIRESNLMFTGIS